MSLRKTLLSQRLQSVGVESDQADTVQAAVDAVADEIVKAAADQAVAAVSSDAGNGGEESGELASEGDGAGDGGDEETGDAAGGEGNDDDSTSNDDGEGDDVEEDGAVLDSGAEEILEINAEGDDVEEEEEAVDAASDIAEGLESIALAMESTLQAGGLTPMTAQGYHFAVEAYCSRANLSNSMPSMESFGGSGTRVHYTQVSVENIRERAKELWRAILEMLEKARAMGMAFLKKVFTMTGQIKSKAQSIAKSAEKLDAKNAESVAGENASKLTVGGKMPTDVAGELVKLQKLLSDSFSYADSAVGYASAVTSGITGIDAGSDERFAETMKKFVEAVSKAAPDFTPASGEYRGNEAGAVGVVGKQTDTHLGEVKVIAVRLADANIDQSSGVRALANQRNTVEIGKGESVEKVPTLNGEQIKAITAAVVDIVDAIDGYKDTASKVDKALGDLTKSGRSFERTASKAETLSAENKKLVNPIISVVKSVPPVVSQPAQKLIQHAMGVCQGALKYCAASVKAHGKSTAVAATA